MSSACRSSGARHLKTDYLQLPATFVRITRDAYLQDVRRESVIQRVLAFMQSAQTTFNQLNSLVKSVFTLPVEVLPK